MKILVLGCGSIGKRHIRNLLSISAGEITVFDTDKEKLDNVKNEFSVKIINNLNNALSEGNYEAAFICTPPNCHVPQALQLLANNIHCFIEKPLSHDLNDIGILMDLAGKKQRITLIGYMLRFSPLLKKIKEIICEGAIGNILSLRASFGYYLPYWRPFQDYKIGYGAKKEQGGGIVLDASHEIDYVRYIAGEINEVFAVCRKVSSLDIDTEDLAEITILHKNGICSQIHLDYLKSKYKRECEIIGSKGMLLWDIKKRRLERYSMSNNEYHVYNEDGINVNDNDIYIAELKHFLNCIKGIEKPLIDLKEGKRIQEIIMKIKESSEKGCFIPV